jgi:hypothetical protein
MGFRANPKRRGVTVTLEDEGLFSAGKDGIRMAGLDNAVSDLEFTVKTDPVTALGSVADVGACILPWHWNDYIPSVDVSNVDGQWDSDRSDWHGRIREHIHCAGIELLTTDLRIGFTAGNEEHSTGFDLLHSVNDILLKDEGKIVVQPATFGSSVQIIKTVEINPETPPALLGKLSKPIIEVVLQAWMYEFVINYTLKGPPDEPEHLGVRTKAPTEGHLPDETVDAINDFLGLEGRTMLGR